ncbi:polysaccharide lyase [Hyalangium versicolor]|uniref:polysaccharide lyase n=1 Tax=Hyalangium versicolor TaxID=2861190 RepID=UPI001CCDA2C8|nr:polysaccharide lyase [Hyalangium versicolor]
MTRFLRLLPFLLVPTLASASTLWKGDFETGNLSQWSRQQSVSSDRLLVVSDVVREGRYALKATVKKGDNPISASGNRNELLYLSRETPGKEYFYKWSTLFPQNYPTSNTWQVFAQWHQDGCCGSPPLEFYLTGEEMRMRVGGSSGKILWRAPLVRGQWNDFVLHVKWSASSKEGFVELYKNGQLVVPKTLVATQFGSEKNYLKLGLYRDASISQTASVYHDGFAMGSTLEDVMPAPVTPPVATPVPETPPSSTPPVAEQPDTTPPTTGIGTTPVVTPPLSNTTTLPDGTGQEPGDFGQPQGCGASASGGMPVIAAGVLVALALLMRRRPALARSRAKRR